MTAGSLRSGGKSPRRAGPVARLAGESAPESCVRSVAGVDEGEERAVEATLELDIAEEVRAGAVVA